MMRFVVAYDIIDNKVRIKIDRCLSGYMYRVQKSVFEGELSEPEFNECLKRLKKIEICDEDSVRIYKICERCTEKVVIIGAGKLIERLPYRIF